MTPAVDDGILDQLVRSITSVDLIPIGCLSMSTGQDSTSAVVSAAATLLYQLHMRFPLGLVSLMSLAVNAGGSLIGMCDQRLVMKMIQSDDFISHLEGQRQVQSRP